MILDRLDAPVVLAPLAGGPSTPALAAAVTSAGGLGFLAAGYLSASDAEERLGQARSLTDGPLGVNVFVPGSGPADPHTVQPFLDRFRAWAERAGAPVGQPRYDDDGWEDKLALIERGQVEAVSFTFGCPEASVVERLKASGTEVWVTVTHPDEARHAAAAGADVLVVQGAEAGGHRGSFTDRESLPVYGLLPLLDLVQAAAARPLVASGGIATGRTLAAVLCAGARAAQIGSAFMLAPEAGTSPPHREALRAPGQTVLTRAFTGRLARGIANEFIAELDAGAPIAYPELHYVTAPMRARARADGDSSRVNLWAGEAHELAVERPAAETVRALTTEARAVLEATARGRWLSTGGEASDWA